MEILLTVCSLVASPKCEKKLILREAIFELNAVCNSGEKNCQFKDILDIQKEGKSQKF